ncbi:hypothetical protein [Protaetiibacter larvae]|uniref:Lipoprotein n=1 Tax=Protaetiibacter larvae TaxID=2592654 RepID=A0A5C1Y6N1_9MICO|nr:hypothetical protein [Protaetiibacter larvae]QEO08865.1 hypothetical protein FLP23_01820 [Protaetiibacter larvae]
MTRPFPRALAAILALTVPTVAGLTGCAPTAPDADGRPGPVDAAAAVADVIESSGLLQQLLLEVGGIPDAADQITALTHRNDELVASATSDAQPPEDAPTAAAASATIEPAFARTPGNAAADAPASAFGAYLGLLQLPAVAREGLEGAANGEPEADASTTETAEGGELAMQLHSRYADGRLNAESSSRMTAASGDASLLVSWDTKIELLACPASDGTLSGSLTFDVQTSVTSGGVVRGASLDVLVSLAAQVDDDAHVTSITLGMEGALRESTTGSEGSTSAYLDGGGTFTSRSFAPGEDFRYTGDGGIRRASQHATSAQKELFIAALTDAAVGLGAIVLDDVERFFRGGSCIDVLVTPGPDAYQDAGQSLEQEITGRSTVDGEEVEGRASAELQDGGASVSPSAELAPTPARVRYTGPSESDGTGSVHYRLVSRRGIGLLDLDYALADAWVLDQSWDGVRYTATKCGGLDGEWTVTRKGTPSGNGGSLSGTITFDLDPVGLIGYLTESSTLSFGSDVMHGTWTGMASLERIDDATVELELDYESGTVEYDGISASAGEVLDPPIMVLHRGQGGACAAGRSGA